MSGQGNFAFSIDTFPDSPFLRTELLELEADCANVQKQSAKLLKGLTAYIAAIDTFRDAEVTFTELLKAVASEGTGTVTEHCTSPSDALKHLGAWLANHSQSLSDLAKSVSSVATEKLTPLSQGTHLKQYRDASSAVAISTTAYEAARRADAGQRRRAARIVLEEARFAQLSTALRVDRESQLQLSDLLLELTMAHNHQALRMLEVTHEGALALGEIRDANQRSRVRLQQEQAELAEAFSAYCSFLEGGAKGPEGRRHIAALGPDTSSRRYKEIASLMLLTQAAGGNPVAIKQGYLWKKYSTLGMESWKKRFFVIDSKGDFYYISNSDRPLPRSNTVAVSEPVLRQSSRTGDLDDSRRDSAGQAVVGGRSVSLLTAGLRPGVEDASVPFAFTVMSPDTTYHLQAESDAERDDWMQVASIVTSELLNNNSAEARGAAPYKLTPARSAATSGSHVSEGGFDSAPSEADGPSVLESLWALEGCGACADCGAPQPDWASLNLGVVFCLQCSGVHRQLGVTVSKVRSCVLDVSAWTAAAIELFRRVGGNSKANSVWEARLPPDGTPPARKPGPNDPLDAKAAFIRAKYGSRMFVEPPPPNQTTVSAASSLDAAVRAGDAIAALRILLSPVNDPSSGPWVSFAGAVLCTAASEPDLLGMLELLLHYLPRACIQAHDETGLTALHHAAKTGNADGVAALLLRGADAAEKDKSGNTALQLVTQRKESLWPAAGAGDAAVPGTPSTPKGGPTMTDIVLMLTAAEATSRDTSEGGLLSP